MIEPTACITDKEVKFSDGISSSPFITEETSFYLRDEMQNLNKILKYEISCTLSCFTTTQLHQMFKQTIKQTVGELV
jgi:hypothetical protein